MASTDTLSRSRFDDLVAELTAKGAHDPRALAAHIGRRKYGHAGFAALAAAGRAKKAATSAAMHSRAVGPLEWGYSLLRCYPLENIEIQRGGDGRTVEAYAAIWDTPAEVRDQHGHYFERISRTAFDKTIRERGDRIPVFYNHGLNVHGTPSDRWSVPIGRSLEVRAESRGLLTISRYNEGADADVVLEAIRNGAITSQSFRGRVYKSDPMRVPPKRGDELPMVTRTELGLTEYGPTPTAVYDGASILALRSQAVGSLLADLGIDLRQLAQLSRTSTTPAKDAEPETIPTPESGAGPEEPRALTHSSRNQSDITRRIRVAQILRSE